jgi:1-aminocyclopropane-1-carboxylate deaminase/D-cysteine desulfhydrase-like pyridoxal-dependent ACC family enzyme
MTTKNNVTALTPIIPYATVLVKREDMYVEGMVNGGKVRQCRMLLENNIDLIRNSYGGRVVCSVHLQSPQSAIVSHVCKTLGLECHIVAYGTTVPNTQLSMAKRNGAILYGTKSPYRTTHEFIIKNYFSDCYWVRMGFVDDSIVNATLAQVENIPDYLDYLVLPIGSGINAVSVVKGLEKYNKSVKNVIGVWVGKNREQLFRTMLGEELTSKIKLVKAHVDYNTHIDVGVDFIDSVYEAKAWHYMTENIDTKVNKVLFWVVGTRNDTNGTEELVWHDAKERVKFRMFSRGVQ